MEDVDLVILMDTSSSVSSHDFLVTKLLLSSALENAFPSDDGSSRFGLAFYADEGELKLTLSQRTSQELEAEMTSDDLSRAVGNAASIKTCLLCLSHSKKTNIRFYVEPRNIQ